MYSPANIYMFKINKNAWIMVGVFKTQNVRKFKINNDSDSFVGFTAGKFSEKGALF